jgi:hypothetical protein
VVRVMRDLDGLTPEQAATDLDRHLRTGISRQAPRARRRADEARDRLPTPHAMLELPQLLRTIGIELLEAA